MTRTATFSSLILSVLLAAPMAFASLAQAASFAA
jgi:hypothetical protein